MKCMRVLVVDDHIESVKTITSILERYFPDCELFQCIDSLQTVDIAIAKKPDLVLTDWDMPNLSGIEVIKKFKKLPELKHIPFLMLTGVMISSKDLFVALEIGANDFIRKPIDELELVARVKSTLKLDFYYKQLLENKNKELTERTLMLSRSYEQKKRVMRKIEILKEEVSFKNKNDFDKIDDLEKELNAQYNEKYKPNFNFIDAHSDFVKTLTRLHTNLTPTDIKICAFIRLGMPNKEIASILSQTADSIKTRRYRIRKKLNLDKENFEIYLLGL